MAQQTVPKEVLQALATINPCQGFSPELYNALARLVPSVAIEAVLLRRHGGEIQVYMTRRSPNDTAYPNQVHSPGSILRAGELYEDVLARLSEREFHAPIIHYDYVGEIFMEEERGWFNNRVLLVQVPRKPIGGEWFSVDALPDDVVDHHVQKVIPMAVAYFKKQHGL
jgi:hypothetical protein